MPVMTKLTRQGKALVLSWDLTTVALLRQAMAEELEKPFDQVHAFPPGKGYTFTRAHRLLDFTYDGRRVALDLEPGDTYTAWWQPKGVGSF